MRPLLTCLALSSLLAASACDSSSPSTDPPLDQPLVEVGWLQERLDQGDDSLLVIDARPTTEYLDGHIPGAVSASFSEADHLSYGLEVSYGGGVDLFLDTYGPIPFQDGDRATVEAAARAMGIRASSEVVIYDNGLHFHAPRLFYTLERHGLRNIHILNGGLTAWSAANGDVATEVPTVSAGDVTLSEPNPSMEATTNDVLLGQADPNVKIVTSLYPNWHYGELLSYSKPGHIPGALPIPLSYLFNSDGTFRSPAQLRALLEVSGVDEDDTIITYCGGNPLSACSYFAWKHVLGHASVLNYEGSLITWLADPRDLPMHTYQHPELMRDTYWLQWWAGARIQRLLMDAPAKVVDLRSAGEHSSGHIPWSISLPATAVESLSASGWASTLGANGLGNNAEIVLCDDGLTPAVGGMFWLLEYLGHPKVSFCAAGISGWTASGFELTEEPTIIADPSSPLDVAVHPTTFMTSEQPQRRLTSADEARIHAAFPRIWVTVSEGVSAPEGESAAHVPWEANIHANGQRLLDAPALYNLYEDQGVSLFQEIVLVGATAGEAGVAYLALRSLGFPMVRVHLPAQDAL